MKIVAIIPALNEEDNIANVLSPLLNSKNIQEVIVVDDGSVDKTGEIAKNMGAKVVTLTKKGGSGKGNAVREGTRHTDADVFFFCDADLKNFSTNHIYSLINPVLKDNAVMSVGIRERLGLGNILKLFIKFDPLSAIAGERVVKRFVFEGVPQKFIKGFKLETALNYYCFTNKLPVRYVDLEGLRITIKEKKWGLLKGFSERLKLIWQIIGIRIYLKVYKEKVDKLITYGKCKTFDQLG